MLAWPNDPNMRSNSASAMNRNMPSFSWYSVPNPGSETEPEASSWAFNEATNRSTACKASR